MKCRAAETSRSPSTQLSPSPPSPPSSMAEGESMAAASSMAEFPDLRHNGLEFLLDPVDRSSESHGSCNQDGVTRDCAHLLGGPDGTVGGARGCSSSTDSLTHPGGSCPIVGSAVSPPCPSQAEDGLPPLPPSNTGAVVRSPSTSARPPSRSSKNEGPQEELAATTSESHIKILTKKQTMLQAQVLEK
nr:uncharacterized protein LOC109761128 isoform X1 [Aegilops tauschii subsp. strangulata]